MAAPDETETVRGAIAALSVGDGDGSEEEKGQDEAALQAALRRTTLRIDALSDQLNPAALQEAKLEKSIDKLEARISQATTEETKTKLKERLEQFTDKLDDLRLNPPTLSADKEQKILDQITTAQKQQAKLEAQLQQQKRDDTTAGVTDGQWKGVLAAVEADRQYFPGKDASARTALYDTVADLTSFTKRCFPKGYEEALKVARKYAGPDVASLLRTQGDVEKKLPKTDVELAASVQEFCDELKIPAISAERLQRWWRARLDVWSQVELGSHDPERHVEATIMAPLRDLFTLLGFDMKSGEVYSVSASQANSETGEQVDPLKTFCDMSATDDKDREVLAHETSECKKPEERYAHAISDRRKLARQALYAMSRPGTRRVPRQVLLLQLHRMENDPSCASSVVLSYMRFEFVRELAVMYDVLEVPVASFFQDSNCTLATSVEHHLLLLGACLQIARDFKALKIDEGEEPHRMRATPNTTKKKKRGPRLKSTQGVCGLGAAAAAAIRRNDKDDDDGPGAGAGGTSGGSGLGGADSTTATTGTAKSTGADTKSKTQSDGVSDSADVPMVCLRDMWGDQQVRTLLCDCLEEAPLRGFNLNTPDFTTSFSSVFLGKGQQAGLVLKVHHRDREVQFFRELHALRQLSGVPGVPAVEAVVRAGDTGGALIMRRLEPIPLQEYHRSADDFMALLHSLVAVLVAAHGRGIAHCDLKNTALMMDGDGDLVLIDWNLARSSTWHTKGRVVGTPQFCLALWRPPAAASLDCCALAVLIGWILGLADLGQAQDNSFEATLDRVQQQRALWEAEPPEEEQRWHAKVLLLVHLLLVCHEDPLEVTYGKWLYGCWLSGSAEQELRAHVRVRRQEVESQLVGFQEHMALLQRQAQRFQGESKEAAASDVGLITPAEHQDQVTRAYERDYRQRKGNAPRDGKVAHRSPLTPLTTNMLSSHSAL